MANASTDRVTLAVHKIGTMRTEQFMGRDHRVFPAILVKSQVLNNNLGATFLPADAITQEWADASNMAPVLIDHPSRSGQPVSARDVGVLNSMGVGFLMNARVEASELKADVFIDLSRAPAIKDLDAILARVEKGEAAELSTGFPVSIEKSAGVFNGKNYELVIRPSAGLDHLAVFATKSGACSVSDGCGLGVNHAGDCNVENELPCPDVAAKDARWSKWVEKVAALMGLKKPDVIEPVTTPKENIMNRDQMIAQLVATNRLGKEDAEKLSDGGLKALCEVPDPKGDGWDKAKEYRAELERVKAQTANAVANEAKERVDLLDDLLFNAKSLPYTEDEIKAMDIVVLRKTHQLAFPKEANYAGMGGPRGTGSSALANFGFVKSILGDGPSVLDDRKEAN